MTGAEFKAALEGNMGWTQAKFASFFKLSPITVNRWCRGQTPVPRWAEFIVSDPRPISSGASAQKGSATA